MKKNSIILNIVLVLVSVFFIVYANIQTKLAKEQAGKAYRLTEENSALATAAKQEAANTRQAEASAVMAQSKAELAMERFLECQGKN
ncbi:MAG: hypothetical protein GY816_14820 [Cytophagales bacterium]|nr:hypothetical protein [Cytophagales bacterium]